MRDLVVLAADKLAAQSVEGLLGRTPSLQIRAVSYDIAVHPQHDPGCLGQSPGLLAVYLKTHSHALVVFDREGSGQEQSTRQELEAQVEGQLARAGWEGKSAVIVIDPELENWVWSNSPHVATALGWRDTTKDVRQWLVEEEYLPVATQMKPARPKEAMDAVLRHVRKPHSSAIFREIARKVSLERCPDPAFVKLRQTLHGWFPA
jgi:hypothetical protein